MAEGKRGRQRRVEMRREACGLRRATTEASTGGICASAHMEQLHPGTAILGAGRTPHAACLYSHPAAARCPQTLFPCPLAPLTLA